MSALDLPETVVPGAAEDVRQAQRNLGRIVDWSGGRISDDNFAATASPFKARGVLLVGAGALGDGYGSGDKLLAQPTGANQGAAVSDGGTVSATNYDLQPAMAHLLAGDGLIEGRTQKLRVRGWVCVNSVASGLTFTFGLYPLTFAGAADTLTVDIGTVVTGSTAAIAPAGYSTGLAQLVFGSDFDHPADGLYGLGVALSGAMAANSAVAVGAALDVGYV